eukprot:Rmarinus@m.11556
MMSTPVMHQFSLENIPRDKCPYQQYYCEENIWKLCDLVRQMEPQRLDRLFAVWVSNPKQRVFLWSQGASFCPETRPVVWDYHVVLLEVGAQGSTRHVQHRKGTAASGCGGKEECVGGSTGGNRGSTTVASSANPETERTKGIVDGAEGVGVELGCSGVADKVTPEAAPREGAGVEKEVADKVTTEAAPREGAGVEK